MVKRAQAGFTLIEVILVMAISSGLAAMAIVGFSAMRGQAQFTDSVERLKERVLVQRQEALSTVKTGANPGTDASTITFGRLLTFTPGSSTVTIETLTTANSNTSGATELLESPPVYIDADKTTTYTMAWGVTYAGEANVQVAFTRNALDGKLQTAVSPAGGWALDDGAYKYAFFAPDTEENPDITLVDSAGRRAYLKIDEFNNGVSRRFE